MVTNFLRIWLCRWGIRGLWHQEYIPKRPESAADLTSLSLILQMCNRFNIEVILTIVPHAHFLTTSHYEVENPKDSWFGNPFQSVSKSPYHFFRKLEVRYFFEKFLAYLYNSFPVHAPPFAVELCNEVDLIFQVPSNIIVDWHRQMFNFCKTLNSKVLLTTSTAVPDSIPALLSLESLDVISIHNYKWPYSTAIANLLYWKNKLSQFNKPLWLTEFDFHSQKAMRNTNSIVYLQSSIIAAYCLGYEMGPSFWWWENTLGQKIVPKLALSLVHEWLTMHQDYYLYDLIAANYCCVEKQQSKETII